MIVHSFALAYAAALAIGAEAPPGEVAAQEPRRPERFSQNVEIRCGSQTLRVSGFGAHIDRRQSGPLVLLNGRELRGGDADRLRRDLSRPGAAYRMMGQCHPRGTILFAFNVGERIFPGERPPGQMSYHRGSAVIGGGRVERYSGLEPISEEQYWFR